MIASNSLLALNIMMEFFIACLAVVVLIAWALISRRMSQLSAELDQARRDNAHLQTATQRLTARVYALEKELHPPPAAPEPMPRVEVPVSPPPVEPQPVPFTPAAPPPAVEAPRRTREDWETLVGENWLNKLGALILVVGLALLMGYSVTQLGPIGKVAIGLAVGISMLGAGVAIERKPEYRTFARGFIAGGWAAIYFTVYAMHGIAAARVIEDPMIATALLLGVAVAMIIHSFSYASEAATAVAYFIAFVALNVSPLTSFSVVAAFLLAASLIVLAYRYSWYRLGVAGALFTYATFALRYEPAVYGRAGLLNGQVTLWTYWLLFEAADLLDIRERGSENRGFAALLFWVNAFGFVIATYVHQFAMNASDWSALLALGAVAYVVSSAARVQLVPREHEVPHFQRILGSGYEPAIVIASLFTAAAIVERFTGLWMPFALLLEGELLVVAGLVLSESFLTWLGGWLLILPVVRLVSVDISSNQKVTLMGREFAAWTPLTLLTVLVFLANRMVTRRGWLYTIVASLLLGAVIHQEFTPAWATVAWAVLSMGSLAGGLYWGKGELRWQSYVFALFIFFRAWIVNLEVPLAQTRRLTTVLVIATLYASQFLLRNREPESQWERHARPMFSLFGTALLTLLLFAEVQGRHVTMVCGVEGVGLLIIGFLVRERSFRLSGLILFLFCIAKLFVYDMRELDTVSRILSFIVLGLMMLGASWIYTRYREQIRRLL